MGVYGALFSAVSGLKAEAQEMGVISDNVSNANTVGYKASVDKFETLVTSPATTTTYTPGGVLSRPFSYVSQQGLMEATQSQTDIGISGNGFIPVTSSVMPGGTLDTQVNNVYTRAGSFTVDKNGNLVNSAGFYLLGVPINQTTGQPSISNPSVQSLSLVNVGTLTGIAKGTSELSIGANLPAVETENTPLSIGGLVQQSVAAGTVLLTDGNTYDVTSSTGGEYALSNVTYTESTLGTATGATVTVTANIAAVGSASPVTFPAVGPGTGAVLGTFTVTATGSTFVAGTGATMQDGGIFQPTIDGSQLKMAAAAATGSTFTQVGIDPQDVTSVVYDSLGVAQNLTLQFSRDGAPNSNQWGVTVQSLKNVQTGASSTTTTLPAFIDGTADAASAAVTTIPATATVTFNTNGTIAAGAPSSIGGAAGLVMTDGAANFGGTGFNLNLGTANTPSGMTQYDDKFAISFLNQNGLAFSYRTGVAFDSSGTVSAVFSNGTTIPLYQIPLVNFANVDALEAETGNVYSQTVGSGEAVSNFAGLGGVGTVTPSALEQSTVDLSTEFANMIITQRSFSANARTITTAATELSEVVNLIR
ncbi:MAG TPA: flagellar hook-basal body complex protein [Candidatus Sulfotelmatobacter sp.]|nr:flagellar hook-basal body complex protein [Candidatus Sulfotelmatobacter sp.]